MQGSLTRPDLKRETQYLEKLLYKNKKQHRASQHFRRLQEASIQHGLGPMHCLIALHGTCALHKSLHIYMMR